nr:uncharacterized protein LOC124809876 [Hydra vulgaris]
MSALVPSSIALSGKLKNIFIASFKKPVHLHLQLLQVSHNLYNNYRFRVQHPRPISNRSFLRWVRLGGNDGESFSWAYHPPNRIAGSYSRRGSLGGGRGQRWNGGGLVVNGGIHYY